MGAADTPPPTPCSPPIKKALTGGSGCDRRTPSPGAPGDEERRGRAEQWWYDRCAEKRRSEDPQHGGRRASDN